MSLIYSAITPHPPILIPGVGKENVEKLKATKAAFDKIKADLDQLAMDTIIVISPHGSIKRDSFTMLLQPEFEANFEEFGDFNTRLKVKGDVALAHRIRESLETKAPLMLGSEPLLDHGVSVPLFLLAQERPIKVIPLYYSDLDLEAHFNFGQLLRKEIVKNHENVAVIASGDLSHRLTRTSPAGYSPKGKKFDKKLTEYLKKQDHKSIIEMDEKLITAASECGLRSIAILLGIMNNIKYEPVLLSYEAPFGIGYLVMNMKL